MQEKRKEAKRRDHHHQSQDDQQSQRVRRFRLAIEKWHRAQFYAKAKPLSPPARRELLILFHFAGLGVVEECDSQRQIGAVEFMGQG